MVARVKEPTKIPSTNIHCQDEPRSSSKRGGRTRLLFLLPVFAIALSVALLKIRSASFVWVWLTWATTFFGACFVLKRDWSRAILFNLGILALCLAAAESYF